MFSSTYFSPEYFTEHFKIIGEIIPHPIIPGVPGGGGSSRVVNLAAIRKLSLDKDDQDILEFIIAFVLDQ